MEVCFKKCVFPREVKNELNINGILFCLGAVLQIFYHFPPCDCSLQIAGNEYIV